MPVKPRNPAISKTVTITACMISAAMLITATLTSRRDIDLQFSPTDAQAIDAGFKKMTEKNIVDVRVTAPPLDRLSAALDGEAPDIRIGGDTFFRPEDRTFSNLTRQLMPALQEGRGDIEITVSNWRGIKGGAPTPDRPLVIRCHAPWIPAPSDISWTSDTSTTAVTCEGPK